MANEVWLGCWGSMIYAALLVCIKFNYSVILLPTLILVFISTSTSNSMVSNMYVVKEVLFISSCIVVQIYTRGNHYEITPAEDFFHISFSFILIFNWSKWFVIIYLCCHCFWCNVDHKMINTSVDEQPLIAKRLFNKDNSSMITASEITGTLLVDYSLIFINKFVVSNEKRKCKSNPPGPIAWIHVKFFGPCYENIMPLLWSLVAPNCRTVFTVLKTICWLPQS